MKTRQGFVSNSSSSSFIVGFSKKVECMKDVIDEVFPMDKNGFRGSVQYEYAYDDSINGVSPEQATELIYEQIKDQTPLTEEQIQERISSGYFDGYPSYDYSNYRKSHQLRQEHWKLYNKNILDEGADEEMKKEYLKASDEEWREHDRQIDEAAKEYFEKNKHLFKDRYTYEVIFSDNDGSIGCIMEHGNTFKNINHVIISHH